MFLIILYAATIIAWEKYIGKEGIKQWRSSRVAYIIDI